MHTGINNSLPYITIQNPPLRLLIDTGCYHSIIRPSIAEKYFPEKIYNYPTKIKTGIGEKETLFKANIPTFPEFRNDSDITFILFDFHHYFDGIIGLNELLRFNFVIDLINKKLVSENVTIPIIYREPHKEIYSITINAHEVITTNVPVSQNNVDIIIPENVIDQLYFPETLTTAKNGYAQTEIYNYTDNPITLQFVEPLQVWTLPDFHKETFDFFYMKDLLPENSHAKQDHKNINIQNLIRSDHLNTEEKSSLFKLLKKFPDIFHQEGDKLTFTNKIKHVIKTTDEIPVHSKTYRYPFVHKEEVQRQINKMLDEGIIRQSQSPWSSPIWVVPKKLDSSGKQKWRICVDYRGCNQKTIDDRYPLPNINDILDRLGRCAYFTTIDLSSGFHQIEMDPGSIEKTAFSVENGHYEYLRMPFGLKNAPATFQRVMDNVLRDLQGKTCLVYMDDIIIFSSSLEEHIKNLQQVFEKLQESRLKVQLDKSEFLRTEVEFLGHVITKDGIKPNSKKLVAIQKFPIPKTAKEIKSFLGLLGYYRRFIKGFAKLTKPFTKCLKKGATIQHNSEFLEAFETCKNVLCNDPVLQYPDFEKPFILTTDASNVAIGAVLSQGQIGSDLPIAYASRTLNPAEINYSTIEKELLAIVWATKYFRPYLFGRKFTIVTDHKPLQYLFSVKEPGSRLVRWRLKMEEFDYEIRYKKGKQNLNADALSRIEINLTEEESIIGNPGDINDEIDKYLQKSENQDATIEELDLLREVFNPEETEESNHQATSKNSNKISIIANVQIRPPINQNESDNETVHSAVENPILNIPIVENCINNYANQVILIQGQNERYHVIKSEIFEIKHRYTVHLTHNFQVEIIKFFKEYVNPKQLFCLYVKKSDVNLADQVSVILSNTFRNHTYKLVLSKLLLTDVTDQDRQKDLIKYHHLTKTCHRGINEAQLALKKLYYWPNMKNDLTEYINNCDICQQTKYDRHPPKIKFALSPTPSQPLESIHIDTFQICNAKFLTIIDVFSRYAQAYPLEPACTATIVLDNLSTFVSHHGLPQQISCDNGTEFKTSLLLDYCKLHNIRIHFTTPGNSNSNSPVERLHSTLIELFRILKMKEPKASTKHLMQYAIIGYNSSVHSVTKQKPFDVINGRVNSLDPFDLTDEVILNKYVDDRKERLKLIYNQIYEQSINTKTRLNQKQNERRENPPEYKPDSKIYVTDKTAKRSKDKPRRKPNIVHQDIGNKVISTKKKVIHKSQIQRPKKLFSSSQDKDNEPKEATPSCSYADNDRNITE